MRSSLERFDCDRCGRLMIAAVGRHGRPHRSGYDPSTTMFTVRLGLPSRAQGNVGASNRPLVDFCPVCHGLDVDMDASDVVASHWPEDRARWAQALGDDTGNSTSPAGSPEAPTPGAAHVDFTRPDDPDDAAEGFGGIKPTPMKWPDGPFENTPAAFGRNCDDVRNETGDPAEIPLVGDAGFVVKYDSLVADPVLVEVTNLDPRRTSIYTMEQLADGVPKLAESIRAIDVHDVIEAHVQVGDPHPDFEGPYTMPELDEDGVPYVNEETTE